MHSNLDKVDASFVGQRKYKHSNVQYHSLVPVCSIRYRRPSLSPPNPSGSCSNMYMHLGKAQPDWFVALICICCGCSTTHFQMPSQGRQRPLLYCQSVRIHDPGILLSSLLPSRTLRCSPSSTSHIVSARY